MVMAAKRKQWTPLRDLNDTQQDLDDFQLPPPSKKPAANNRFAAPKSDGEITVLSKGPIVPNTEKCTIWATRVFDQWSKERNALSKNVEKCPTTLLESPDPVKLNYWLSYFIVEARQEDGKPYPATSLYQLLAGLLRYARSKNKECPNF